MLACGVTEASQWLKTHGHYHLSRCVFKTLVYWDYKCHMKWQEENPCKMRALEQRRSMIQFWFLQPDSHITVLEQSGPNLLLSNK